MNVKNLRTQFQCGLSGGQRAGVLKDGDAEDFGLALAASSSTKDSAFA